jgi:hypothetical protein
MEAALVIKGVPIAIGSRKLKAKSGKRGIER